MECHLAGVDTDPYFKVCLCNPSSNNITFPLKFTHSLFKYKGMLASCPCEEKTALAQTTHLALNQHVLFLTLNCDQQNNLKLLKLNFFFKKKPGHLLIYSHLLHCCRWGYVTLLFIYSKDAYCLPNSVNKFGLMLCNDSLYFKIKCTIFYQQRKIECLFSFYFFQVFKFLQSINHKKVQNLAFYVNYIQIPILYPYNMKYMITALLQIA